MADAEDELYDVVCYGTISFENVTRVSHLPTPRRDAVAVNERDDVGGEAIKVGVPLAAWGLRVAVVGNFIGTDRKARWLMSRLAAFPLLDTRYIHSHENITTPFLRVLLTPDGQRTRITYWYDQTPKDELGLDLMKCARVLSVDAYGRDERDRAAAMARALDKTVISADAIWPQYPLAGQSHVVIISNAWLQTNFPGAYEYDHALDLQSRGAGVIIITDGDKPVLVVRSDGSAFGVEPYRLERIVDANGAGELFKAGIIYGWLQPDWPLEQKMKFACAAAGLGCQRERVLDPPTLDDIFALMAAQPR
jgi:sugar/nucleoside kinase (ribokinase family)